MHPVLFTVFGAPVHAYAAAVTLGYVVGVLLGVALGLRDRRTLGEMLDLGLVIVLGAVLGSKLFHVLFEAAGHRLHDGRIAGGVADLLRDDPWHWARLLEPGYVFYGGVLGAIAVGVLYCWRQGVPDLGAVGDYAVPGIVFGTFVGRVGCFLAGCCHGAPTSLPWAVVFPAGHPSGGVPVHPVQLYDAAFGAAGCLASALLYRRRRFGGELFLGWLVAYALYRFGTELLRADVDRGLWLGGRLSTSQIVALATLPASLLLWRRALGLVRRAATPSASAHPGVPSSAQEHGAR